MEIKKRLLLVFLVFAIVSTVLVWNHEPWRDEARAWIIARDAPNYPAMVSGIWAEGTPALWHTLIYPLAKLQAPYYTLKILHLIIILAAVLLFLRRAPFPKSIKFLFPFGYFILYEYNALARNYALSVLLLFLAATYYQHKLKTKAYPFLLFLLANTNVYSFSLSFILFADYVYDYYQHYQKTVPLTKMMLVIGLVLSALFIPFIQMLPPAQADLGLQAPLSFNKLAGSFVGPLTSAFLPVPQWQPQFWGTRMLYNPSPYFALLMGGIFAVSLSFFRKHKRLMLIYLSSVFCLYAIFLVIGVRGIRHHGFIYLMFIFCAWILYENCNSRNLNSCRNLNRSKGDSKLGIFLIFIFLIHIVAAIPAVYYEMTLDFSNAQKAAYFLEEKKYLSADTVLATSTAVMAESIIPYFPANYRLYCLEINDYCNGVLSITAGPWPEAEKLKTNYDAFKNAHQQRRLILLTDSRDVAYLSDPDLVLIQSFENSITAENYYLYEVRRG